MKAKFLTVYCLLFTVYHSSAQVPADSLTGTYAGQYWVANPSTNPWIITPDTLFVSNVDSTNCTQLDNSSHILGGSSIYYTDYYSCNSPAPTNGYVKFYSGDSVRLIADNVPQQPPNSPWSWRFFGKRISNKTVGINELMRNEQIYVCPNPSGGVFQIVNSKYQTLKLDIYNIIGEVIYSSSDINSHIKIDLSNKQNGVYFLRIETINEIVTTKIIINKRKGEV